MVVVFSLVSYVFIDHVRDNGACPIGNHPFQNFLENQMDIRRFKKQMRRRRESRMSKKVNSKVAVVVKMEMGENRSCTSTSALCVSFFCILFNFRTMGQVTIWPFEITGGS